MDVRIHRLLGMGDPGNRAERGLAVKFSVGIGRFAGTSHSGNSHVGCSLFEFHANGMFPEERHSETYYIGLRCPRRRMAELACVGGRISAQ